MEEAFLLSCTFSVNLCDNCSVCTALLIVFLGTITCLEFYGTAHLLSGAEDGLICIWNTKRWECLKSIKAHK